MPAARSKMRRPWPRTKLAHEQALRPRGDEITLDVVERITV
jgi:hypothetical protein